MSFLNTLRLALRALRRNTLRSTLTGLGMIIGVGAVIALVGIGNGAQEKIEEQISDLGENLLMVFPGSYRQAGGARSGWGGRSTLKPDDAIAIMREVPYVVAVSPEARSRSQVVAAGRNWNTTVLGQSPDYPLIRNWPVARGAMFTWVDVDRIGKVAVVGQTVVDQLFPDGRDPLGQVIRVGNVPFQIVGVLAPKGFNTVGQDQDDVIVIPYTAHLKRISRRDYVNSIVVQVADAGLFPVVQDQVSALLRERHRLAPEDEPDFAMRTQLEIVERATATTRTMTLLLAAVAGVSLLVGGIGIMNIMLVSVTERTREIGLRLAIGAHDRDVLRQFLCEAVIMSLFGGLLGVGLGVLGSKLLEAVKGWPVNISTESILVAALFSASVGIFFGYYPARRAARLDPIEALRHE